MKKSSVFNRFQNVMQQLGIAYEQFHRYSACFSVRSIDDEMESIFRRIILLFTKINKLIQAQDNATDDHVNKMFSTIDFSEEIVVDQSIFFPAINDFLIVNRDEIVGLLSKNHIGVQISTEVVKLETQLLMAQKIVDRIKVMLRGSQQIYQNPSADSKTA